MHNSLSALNTLRVLMLACVLGVGGFALTGCEQGPAEEAGEELDEAADEVEDAFN